VESNYYKENADFKRFVDKNAEQYGKTVEFMLLTPTVKEYEKYLKAKEKGKIEDSNKSV